MKRNILTMAITLLAGLVLLSACATVGGKSGKSGGPAKAEPGYKYVCACGPECSCGTSADKPGLCTCGKPMAYKKVLRDYPNQFGVCPCDNCACDTVKRENPNQCGCGKDLQLFPKEGRYVCACKDCDCNTTSRNPGKCVCGEPMKARW